MSEIAQVTGKRLLFVTGTRADYGKLEPLAKAAQAAGFHISFFITGMHMMRRYGETRLEVRRFEGAEFFEFVNQRAGDPQDMTLAKTVMGFSDFVHEHRPDLVIIHGDRVEAMAAAIVCAMRYIPSAHIEGGEVSGTIDESLRHCNTKLCSSHFVSSDLAKQRVLMLGESPSSVFVIGSPELDVHAHSTGIDISEVKRRYSIPFDEYGIVIFHPVTSERDTIGGQAQALFNAIQDSGKSFVVILPNNDPGTDDIMRVLAQLPNQQFRLIPSMRFAYFSELLRHACLILGNSSAGVREAPFIGIPSIDIGTRQNARTQSQGVVHCSAHDTERLTSIICDLWGKRYERDWGFGLGNSSQSFVKIIQNSGFWTTRMQKTFNAQESVHEQ